MIKFSSLKKLFPKDKWDVGYITATQLKICAYKPIKWKCHTFGLDFTNDVHFFGLRNCIVLIRHTSNHADYDFYGEAAHIMKQSAFKWHMCYTNFKEAALQAGLGVRAKNSLIYSYRFGFDSKICVIGFDDKIIDPPTNKRVNRKLWNRCVDCNDCSINCPAKAIHNNSDDIEHNWLDSSACDNFLGISDHPRIPSIKKFWHENVYPELSKKEVKELNTREKVQKKYPGSGYVLPWNKNGYTFHSTYGAEKDGKPVDVPLCRECTSQPRCSKWNGQYPYSKKIKTILKD